jgi:hypothetical protein
MSTAILFLVVFQAEAARASSPPLAQGSQMNASRTVVPGFAEESSVDEADYEEAAEKLDGWRSLSGLSIVSCICAATTNRKTNCSAPYRSRA